MNRLLSLLFTIHTRRKKKSQNGYFARGKNE